LTISGIFDGGRIGVLLEYVKEVNFIGKVKGLL
jgi:hypothetical protein